MTEEEDREFNNFLIRIAWITDIETVRLSKELKNLEAIMPLPETEQSLVE